MAKPRDLVFTTPEVWSRYGDRLPAANPLVHFVDTTDLDHLLSRFGAMSAEVVYGFGGGQAIDVAKFVGQRCHARVIAVPTILSVDAPLVPGAAVRVAGRVVYVPTRAPDEVVIHEDILLSAPITHNAAGWGDVLSIYTAVWDWRLGHERTGESFDERIADEALALLETACRPDTSQGIHALLAALRKEVELCDQAGSSRPEEGSEHLFAYTIEPLLPASIKVLHGELVGVGIRVMSGHQGQSQDKIAALMDRVGLRWRAEELGISPQMIAKAERSLPRKALEYGFHYTIANEMGGA
jgi:glycerol-1-phosphate dehydrogenase [NAD(P)+]